MNGPASFISPCNADPSTSFLSFSHGYYLVTGIPLFKEA